MAEASTSQSGALKKRLPTAFTLHVEFHSLYETVPAIISINHVMNGSCIDIEILPKQEPYSFNLYIATPKSEGIIDLTGNAQVAVGYGFVKELSEKLKKRVTLKLQINLFGRYHMWYNIKKKIRTLMQQNPHMFVR